MLSDATTLGLSGSGSDRNKGVVCIPQSSIITEASPSDCLESYPGHLLGWEFLHLCRDAVMYSTAPANWATGHLLGWGVLHLSRDAVGVFYSPNQLSHKMLVEVAGVYTSAEMQLVYLVYSTALTNWATGCLLKWQGFTPLQRCSWCILQT